MTTRDVQPMTAGRCAVCGRSFPSTKTRKGIVLRGTRPGGILDTHGPYLNKFWCPGSGKLAI